MVEVDLNSPLDPAVSLEDSEPASRVLVDPNHSNIHPHLDHLKSNQIKSNQIKSNQIEPSQTKPNQIKSNQIKSNQIKSNQIKSNQIKIVVNL